MIWDNYETKYDNSIGVPFVKDSNVIFFHVINSIWGRINSTHDESIAINMPAPI